VTEELARHNRDEAVTVGTMEKPPPSYRRFLQRKPLPPGEPGVDRPKLVRDLGWFKRKLVGLSLLLIAAAGAYGAVRTYAGMYHALTGLSAWQNATYHKIFPVDWFRHLIIRDANEKVFAGATLQVLVYNFASHWPRKAPNKWDRFEGHLGIANARIDGQGLIVLLLAPLWLLIYALPGELAVAGILWASGQNETTPPTWQVSLVGFTGSVLLGRRIAKGFAYHIQRIMIRERLENRAMRNGLRESRGKRPRKYTAAWWMLWPVRQRLHWVVSRKEYTVNRPWKHRRLQIAVHGIMYLAIVAGVVYLTWRGAQLLRTDGI
jgi:hypothetical protein